MRTLTPLHLPTHTGAEIIETTPSQNDVLQTPIEHAQDVADEDSIQNRMKDFTNHFARPTRLLTAPLLLASTPAFAGSHNSDSSQLLFAIGLIGGSTLITLSPVMPFLIGSPADDNRRTAAEHLTISVVTFMIGFSLLGLALHNSTTSHHSHISIGDGGL